MRSRLGMRLGMKTNDLRYTHHDNDRAIYSTRDLCVPSVDSDRDRRLSRRGRVCVSVAVISDHRPSIRNDASP